MYLRFIAASHVQKLAPLFRTLSDIDRTLLAIDRIVTEHLAGLRAADPERQSSFLGAIEAVVNVLSPSILILEANLTRTDGQIARTVLHQDTQKDYIVVAFIVDGPGRIHNHKKGIVGTGVSLNDSDGIERRFKQKYPDATDASADLVEEVERIHQEAGTVLRELGAEDDLIHQITIGSTANSRTPNIRLHVYWGGQVSVTGDPNATFFLEKAG